MVKNRTLGCPGGQRRYICYLRAGPIGPHQDRGSVSAIGIDSASDPDFLTQDEMNHSAAHLYLNLMKQVLSFSLWPEPPIPLDEIREPERGRWRRWVGRRIACVLKRRGLQLVKHAGCSDEERRSGRIWPRSADTMIGLPRLDNIQRCIESVLRENIEGDFIETGVWRGGACIFMKAVLTAYGVEGRRVFVADSFQGLPRPDGDKYPADQGDLLHTFEALAVPLDEVRHNFRKYGLLDDGVVFLPGWFKDTLPAAPMDKLAVLRLDGDLYGSTMEALVALYPKLSAGGYCIVDDYALPGCQRAVDDFRREHGIGDELETVDWTGR